MFRKVISILIICIFSIQLVGFTVYFFHEKAKISKQLKTYLKKGVPKNQLINFDFSKVQFQNLQWTKLKKEFKIEDRYYDIVWKKDHKGRVILQCVDDQQESKLFKNLAFYLEKNITKKSQNNSIGFMFEIVNHPYIINEKTLLYSYLSVNEISKVRFYINNNLLCGHNTIPKQPPISTYNKILA